MKILKFFGAIFNLVAKYDSEKTRYMKSGYVGKVVALILMLGMVALVLACEYGTIWLFENLATIEDGALALFGGNFLMIFGGVILACITISMGFSTIGQLIQNAIIGFASACSRLTIKKRVGKNIANSIDSKQEASETVTIVQGVEVSEASKVEEVVEEAKESEQVEETASTQETQPEVEVVEQTEKVEEVRKTAKWFDILYGTLCLLFIPAMIGGMVAMFII